jgi:hypothetical protein
MGWKADCLLLDTYDRFAVGAGPTQSQLTLWPILLRSYSMHRTYESGAM